MEAVDLQQGEAATITIVPPSPWAAPITCELKSRSGTLLYEPTATPSSVSTTVDGNGTSASVFEVASATGIVRGLTVQVTDSQWGTAQAVVASVDDAQVTLVAPLPGVPFGGATVIGLDISVAITDEMTEDLGLSYVLEVKKSGVSRRRVFNVVTFPFVGPCDEMQIREHMTRHFPGERSVHSAEWGARTAAEVNRLIRGRLLESAVYTSQFWDAGALEEIGLLMRDMVLFRKGYRYPGTNPDDFARSTNIELERRIGALLKSGTPSDADMDGVIDDDEVEGYALSLLVR